MFSQEFQLGTGRNQVETKPVVLPELMGKIVVSCAAGETHSAAILSDGTTYLWGSGDMGKLGHGLSDDVTERVPRVC